MGFSTIMTRVTVCLNKGEFVWSKLATKAFVENKDRLSHAPILTLLDFSKVFEVACDVSGVGRYMANT